MLNRLHHCAGACSELDSPPHQRQYHHAGQVDQIFFVETIDKYVTISRDGSFRLWNGVDLKHFRTMTLGSAWITSGIYMPVVSVLCCVCCEQSGN